MYRRPSQLDIWLANLLTALELQSTVRRLRRTTEPLISVLVYILPHMQNLPF